MNNSRSALVSNASIDTEEDMFADLPPLDPFVVKKDQIAAHLAALLSHSGKTRTEVAEALGWKKSRVTSVLSGKSNLTVRTIWDFCSSLSFDFDVVFRSAWQPVASQPWQQHSKAEASLLSAITAGFPVVSFEEHTPEKIAADVKSGTNYDTYMTISFSADANRTSDEIANRSLLLDLVPHNISASDYYFLDKIKPELDIVPPNR
ncbi:transcriptional regulator with XRE-family HTH domain [Variovorax sp. OAS795]|uniref:helix-turn-helix domain-containing protein n=1 Tax=Variovorax sp. OAS795 TaxID=3034231 RepID=UPI00339B47B1